eukprot:m.93535 g.93535  ORF g.93535 m.93535 type:complete len:50 (+) comp21788_c0_seq2:37-186(+)
MCGIASTCFVHIFVQFVFQQGLIEVCKVRPEDPVDYLAEYLFKQNPQVD